MLIAGFVYPLQILLFWESRVPKKIGFLLRESMQQVFTFNLLSPERSNVLSFLLGPYITYSLSHWSLSLWYSIQGIEPVSPNQHIRISEYQLF